MAANKCCESAGNAKKSDDHEIVAIERTRNVCPVCEEYAQRHASKPIAIMSCEGACLRGEIARRAANLVCHRLAPEKTVRICLGGAFTKDTGQRGLVRNAPRVVALEGCFIECASRMMKGAVAGLSPEVIVTDKLCDFDRALFGVDELTDDEIDALAGEVAENVIAQM